MKKLSIALLALLTFSLSSLAQTPTTETKKKMVKFGAKFYIETTTTSKSYEEVTDQLLFQVDNDDSLDKSEADEIARRQAERAEKKAERIERNKLLKEAIEKGYKPTPTTLEDQERIKKIEAKIGVKKKG